MPELGLNRVVVSQVVLSLGSNVGARTVLRENIQLAIDGLIAHPNIELDKVSLDYFSSPVDYLDQSDFCNICVGVKTSLLISDFHHQCKFVESEVSDEILCKNNYEKEYTSRPQKTVFKGPRVIDIDIIFYGDAVIKKKELVVPHQSYRDRLFVLRPLLEIYPDMVDPLTNRLVKDYLKNDFKNQRIECNK